MIAPLEYFAMPLAILSGVFFFGEWPDLIAGFGMTLIIGAGLFVWWRETRASDKTALAHPTTRR